MMTKEEIGKIIKNTRLAAGLTQKQVAEQLNRPQQTIANWEVGRSQPDANTLFELFQILDADLNTAFGFTTKKDPANLPIDEARKRVVDQLCNMPKDEFELVDAFIQGMRAKRRGE